MDFKEPSVPQNKLAHDSQKVAEYLEKRLVCLEECLQQLLIRLSSLLFDIEKHMDEVLLQEIYLLAKKFRQWASQARSLKRKGLDHLNKQNRKGDWLTGKELEEVCIEIINHIRKCPFKDDYMYDKPVPDIRSQSDSSKQPTRSEKDDGMTSISAGPTVPAVEFKNINDDEHYSASITNNSAKTEAQSLSEAQRQRDKIRYIDSLLNEKLTDFSVHVGKIRIGSEPIYTSESMQGSEILTKVSPDLHDEVVLAIAPSNTDSASIPGEQIEMQCTTEDILQGKDDGMKSSSAGASVPAAEFRKINDVVTVMQGDESDSASIPGDQSELQSAGDIMEEAEVMPTSSSDFDLQQAVESAAYGEIKVVREISTLSGAEKEQYVVIVEGNRINLELDNQTISIGDYPSSGQLENSSVNLVLNLVKRGLRMLPENSDYPKSFLLFLQRKKHLTVIHESFFDTTPDLHFLDMSYTRIRILPSSLFKLSQLKVLMLRNCVCLENLPSEIGNLSLLEVLDLSGTELYSLPDEIGQLTLLSCMHLSFYGPDDGSEYAHLPTRLISPDFLSNLKALQSISIAVHPDDHRWKKIAARIAKDVGMLEMLGYLQFYFPQVEMFENFIRDNPSWKNGKLEKFKFVVGRNVKRIASRVPNEIESLFDKHGQCLRFVNGDMVPEVIGSVLQRVEAFYMDHHTKIQCLSEFGLSNFGSLKFCLVRECPKFQAILGKDSTDGAFPCLEYLGVYYLWELDHICKSPPSSESFKALVYLTVSTCPKLEFILWDTMLPCLSNLKELVVEDCESVVVIVKKDKKKVKCDAITLPAGLRRVVLHYLPMLVSLGNGLCLPDDRISIHGCPKLIRNPQPRQQPMVKERKFMGSLRAALQFK